MNRVKKIIIGAFLFVICVLVFQFFNNRKFTLIILYYLGFIYFIHPLPNNIIIKIFSPNQTIFTQLSS